MVDGGWRFLLFVRELWMDQLYGLPIESPRKITAEPLSLFELGSNWSVSGILRDASTCEPLLQHDSMDPVD